jgi:hypothetical protein
VTEVQEVTPYILGAGPEDQKLGLKGGETKSMFLFLDELLPSHVAAVKDGRHMLAASRALKRHLAVMKEAPRVFSVSQEREPRTKWITPTLLNGIRRRTAKATTRSDIDGGRSSVFPFLGFPSTQDFHESQLAALRAMRRYCVWTPKFHQWLHMSRTSAFKAFAKLSRE